jgi:NAD(P)H-flavin reductase
LEWHPFSVSSSPREIDVEFHIRGLGDWSDAVVEMSAGVMKNPDLQLPYVRIDGPYGVHDFNMREYPAVMLCGGGVGVTPIVGLLKDIYNVGNFTQQERRRVIPHRMEVVYCIWVVLTLADYEWFRVELEEMAVKSQLPQFPALQTWVYVTRGPDGMPAPLLKGRPEFVPIFDDLNKTVPADKAVLTFACGPGAMVNEIWDLSVTRSAEGRRTDFHHETFDF